jgi:O-antigen/teichoic acid export membrane protein
MDKKFFKDFSIYGVGGILSRFVGIVTAPIYTRVLSIEDYGLLDLIISVSAILIIFVTMEMQSGYARSYYEAKNKNQLEILRGSVMMYFIVSFLFMLILFYFLYDRLDLWINLFDVSLLLPVMLQLLPSAIITLALLTIQFEKQPLLYSFVTIGNVLLTAGLGIISVTYMDMGVRGILWSNVIAGYIVCVILITVLVKYTRFTFNIAYLKETICFSMPIVPSVLGSWLNNSIGRIFIAGALSISMLGVYSIALKVCLIIALAGSAFKQTWSPKANELFVQKGSETQFADALNYYLFGFTGLVILVVSVSPVLVRILAPEEYYPAVSIIGVLAVGFFWDGAKNILSSGNNWERKTYFNSLASIAGGIINIFILYFFINAGGVLLAATGFTIGAIIQAFLLLCTSQKNHFIPYSNVKILFSLSLLVVYSISTYCSYFAFSVYDFVAFQLFMGAAVLGIMYFTLFSADERTKMLKLLEFRTK